MRSSGITDPMAETAEARLKRLKIRAWRRGTKEMDLVLGPWADAHLAELSPERLELFESVMAQEDQDLMSWMMGYKEPPTEFAAFIQELGAFAEQRLRKI